MIKRSSILFVTLLLLPLQACFYSDSEMYEVDPLPGDPPDFAVTTNLDTLSNPPVNDSLEVSYQVEIEGGELYYVYAEIANKGVFESDSTYGSFQIYPVMANDSGVDTLYIELYYSTNTNSLADKVGYEAFIETLKIAVDFNL